ncbi:hypothetical protein I4U23_005166 [Adineta vaga]|nr:hypothetical protein I4U23_005166 [Adineta vaga]
MDSSICLGSTDWYEEIFLKKIRNYFSKDRYQSSSMGRRRPWIIFSQICALFASFGLLFVHDPVTKSLKTLVIAFFIHSIFASIQDASVDAQAITMIRKDERGKLNSFMRAGFLIGSSIGSAGLSWILRNIGYFQAALINSIVLFLFTLLTFFIKEKSDDQLFPCSKKRKSRKDIYQQTMNYSIGKLFHELFRSLFSKESIRLVCPILIVYLSQSIFIRAYNIHLIKVLHWSDTSVSILSGTWGTLIVILVVLLTGYLSDRIGSRRLLIVVVIIHGIYMFTVNLITSFWYKKSIATIVLILWSMMDPLLSSASMPVLMSLCHQHIEGSQFTTYMSMVNLSDLFGSFLSGHLQNRFQANFIGLGCAFSILIAFFILIISLYFERKHRIIHEKLEKNILI